MKTPNIKPPTNLLGTLRHPSAFVPIGMSFTALLLVLLHVALYGSAREADEGTVAHLWQLLMGLQIPLIGFFAINWLPQSARSTIAVLTLQVLAVLIAVAPVWYYHL